MIRKCPVHIKWFMSEVKKSNIVVYKDDLKNPFWYMLGKPNFFEPGHRQLLLTCVISEEEKYWSRQKPNWGMVGPYFYYFLVVVSAITVWLWSRPQSSLARSVSIDDMIREKKYQMKWPKLKNIYPWLVLPYLPVEKILISVLNIIPLWSLYFPKFI